MLLACATGVALAQEAAQLKRQDHKSLAVTAYAPRSPACKGIAIVSPGAGGSERGYAYLGEALSSLGFLAVVIGHQESGLPALREHLRGNSLREGLAELITEPQAYRGRLMDIAATKSWAQTRCDASTSILVGHSMGAATTLMEAGARNKLGIQGADAFDAYIALSPQGAGIIFPENAWAGIRKPVLLLTGTRDAELGGASWETRTEPFRSMPPGCKWLAVIGGATHMNFAGRGQSAKTQVLVMQITGAFIEGVRRGDCRPGGRVDGAQVMTK